MCTALDVSRGKVFGLNLTVEHDGVDGDANAVGSTILPEKYYTHAVLAVVAVITVYTFAQGRKTNRARDLHGGTTRTILITAASHLEVISSWGRLTTCRDCVPDAC